MVPDLSLSICWYIYANLSSLRISMQPIFSKMSLNIFLHSFISRASLLSTSYLSNSWLVSLIKADLSSSVSTTPYYISEFRSFIYSVMKYCLNFLITFLNISASIFFFLASLDMSEIFYFRFSILVVSIFIVSWFCCFLGPFYTKISYSTAWSWF